jgi:hypothetical protein
MFVVEGKVLVKAFGDLKKILEGAIESVQIKHKDNELFISAQRNTSRAKMILNCKGSGKAKFAINVTAASNVWNNRGEMEFKYNGTNAIDFKLVKGRYSGSLVVIPYTDISVFPDEVKLGKELPPKLCSMIFKIIPKMTLVDPFKDNTLCIQFSIDKKQSRVACGDPSHLVVYEGSGFDVNFDMAIPTNYAQIISSVVPEADQELQFSSDTSHMYLKGKTVELALPLLPNSLSWKNVDHVLNNFKIKGSAECNLPEIEQSISNFSGLLDSDSAIKCQSTKKGLEFTVKTSYGQAIESIPIQGKLPDSVVKIEPHTFLDVVSKLSEKATISYGMQNDQVKFIRFDSTFKKGKITAISVVLG